MPVPNGSKGMDVTLDKQNVNLKVIMAPHTHTSIAVKEMHWDTFIGITSQIVPIPVVLNAMTVCQGIKCVKITHFTHVILADGEKNNTVNPIPSAMQKKDCVNQSNAQTTPGNAMGIFFPNV